MNNYAVVIISGENEITNILVNTLTEKGLDSVTLKSKQEVEECLQKDFSPQYLFVIDGFNSEELINETTQQAIKKAVKVEIILPYGFDTNINQFKEMENENLYIVYVGEIDKHLLVNELLRGIFSYGFPEKEVMFGKPIEYKKIEAVKAKNETNQAKQEEPQIVETLPINKEIQLKRPKIKLKKVLLFMFVLVWIICLPLILLFGSAFALKAEAFNVAKPMAFVASKAFIYFDEGKRMANFIYDYSDALILANNVKQEIKQIGKEKIDANKLYLTIDDLNNRVSYLQAETKRLGSMNGFSPKIDLAQASYYLANIKEIVRYLPQLTGYEAKVNYLILIQDKNELWPTGGKIRKFGIITFEDGKVIDTKYYENKDLDNQIKGEITPPLPLTRYLGINNWNFSTSNWDGDFNQVAQRAIWFVDKGMGVKIDGVIAVDEAKYESLQKTDQFYEQIFEELNKKEILVYFNDEKFYSALSHLNWDGGFSEPKCNQNCYVFYTGLVEANLGGNKIDKQITRSVNINLDLTNTEAKTKLEVTTLNQSNETYKDYLRILGGELYKYLTINSKGKVTSSFEWKEEHKIDFTKSGKIIVYIRKQPGVEFTNVDLNIDLPAGLTTTATTSYNTNLTGDFYKEISF